MIHSHSDFLISEVLTSIQCLDDIHSVLKVVRERKADTVLNLPTWLLPLTQLRCVIYVEHNQI